MTTHVRTTNQAIRPPRIALPVISAGHVILTSDPNTLNSNDPRESDGHGRSGTTHMLVTIAIGTVGAAVTITAWIWVKVARKWMKLGADSTEYSKQFDANTITGFTIPAGTTFYLQGSANVDEAYIDCEIMSEIDPDGSIR